MSVIERNSRVMGEAATDLTLKDVDLGERLKLQALLYFIFVSVCCHSLWRALLDLRSLTSHMLCVGSSTDSFVSSCVVFRKKVDIVKISSDLFVFFFLAGN